MKFTLPFMQQDLPEHAIEFTHGYTYSAHPVACAAALAALEVLERKPVGSIGSIGTKF